MIQKKKNSSGDSVRVTFELPGEVAKEQAAIAGSFNNWNPQADPMDYVKSRKVWKKGITLDAGETYEFRYLVDGNEWRNDEEADGYVPNEFASENSVLKL